jgi:hypothetical protein
MNQATRVLLLLGVFFAGCAAQQVAAHYVVPPARADAPAPRQQWQYLCWRGSEDITMNANKYGQDGWEMVAAAGSGSGQGLAQHETMVWCFKRPVE